MDEKNKKEKIMEPEILGIPNLPIFDLKQSKFASPMLLEQPDHIWNNLWDVYYDGVVNQGLHFYSKEFPADTWVPILNYLHSKTGLPKQICVAFLNALESWSNYHNDTRYINPLRAEEERAEVKQQIEDVIQWPMKVVSEGVAKGTRNISEALLNPLMIIGGIAVVGVGVYAYFQFKKKKK